MTRQTTPFSQNVSQQSAMDEGVGIMARKKRSQSKASKGQRRAVIRGRAHTDQEVFTEITHGKTWHQAADAIVRFQAFQSFQSSKS